MSQEENEKYAVIQIRILGNFIYGAWKKRGGKNSEKNKSDGTKFRRG